MFFKPKTTHGLPYQFFFHRDSVFHAHSGTLLVNSRRHGLDEAVINYAIVGVTQDPSSLVLDRAMATALVEEARKAGYDVLAIRSFYNHLYPITANRLRLHRLNPSQGAQPFATVKVMRYLDREVLELPIADERYQAPEIVPITPHNLAVIFDAVMDQGYLPLGLLGHDGIFTAMAPEPLPGTQAWMDHLTTKAEGGKDVSPSMEITPPADHPSFTYTPDSLKVSLDDIVPAVIRRRKRDEPTEPVAT